jgi:CBS-domain-containing membrane protein
LRQIACPSSEIALAEPDEPLSSLLPRLHGCADGRAVVVDKGRLIGIVSPSDISRAVALRGLGVELDAGGVDLTRASRS